MLHSGDLDFSFSGIKTAVRYALERKELDEAAKQAVARDFVDACVEVLTKKTQDAVTQYGARTVIIGGGVSASKYLREGLQKAFLASHPDVTLYFPNPGLSTDNSVMIALAGHPRANRASNPTASKYIKADGNRSLASE